jgi:DNA-binding IclR family transcriptional regulator
VASQPGLRKHKRTPDAESARDGYLPVTACAGWHRGSAITVDEITPGVWACAAAIVENDEVVAAMSVAGPALRIGRARQLSFQTKLRAAAASVSAVISERQCPTPARLTA